MHHSKDKEQPFSHGHPALAIMENGQVRSNNQGAWKYILSGPIITHYSLLITHYSLLITHYSLLITHYSLLITNDK
ncbi:hypothetical protein, partial [Acinetobacter tandoii]